MICKQVVSLVRLAKHQSCRKLFSMLASEVLAKIHDPWLERASAELSKNEVGKMLLADELERYFELLQHALESGDPGWLNPLLIDWAASRTETELTTEEITLAPVLDLVATSIIRTAQEHLSPEEANILTLAYLPVIYYSYEHVAQHEILVRVGYYSAKLEQVTNELTKLDRSKSHFIAVAAHELKTPLTLIEGYSAMLADIIGASDTGQQTGPLLQGIKKGLTRLGEMVNDMIDVSMIDNDLLSLRFQPTWVSQILSNLEKELGPSIEEREQEFIVEPFEGFKEMVIADTERVQQAIRNVLINAIKYTPNKGKITVDGQMLSTFLEIRISDTGIGISPENQDVIFDKFSGLGDAKLHSSSKFNFKGGGPGLGLPIAKGIMEAHGGSIWVESDGYDEEELPGCTFHLLLPARKEPPDDQMAKLFTAEPSETNQET